jgi:hypothetical protein
LVNFVTSRLLGVTERLRMGECMNRVWSGWSQGGDCRSRDRSPLDNLMSSTNKREPLNEDGKKQFTYPPSWKRNPSVQGLFNGQFHSGLRRNKTSGLAASYVTCVFQ